MHFSLEKSQKLVDRIVSASNCQDSNDKLRLNHYIWLSIIAIPLSLIFIAKNLLIEHDHIAIIISFFFVFICSCLFVIPKVKSLNLIYHTNNCVFMTMLLLVSNYGNITEGQILWCYIYPILSIFLFGYQTGVKWSLFLLTAVIISLQLNTNIEINYHFEFFVLFTLPYSVSPLGLNTHVVVILKWLKSSATS